VEEHVELQIGTAKCECFEFVIYVGSAGWTV